MLGREIILSVAKEQFNFHRDAEFFSLEEVLRLARKRYKYEHYIQSSSDLLDKIALIIDREIK